MNNEEKKILISKIIRKDETYKEDLPKKLYKYRPFDSYSFDMLENNYLYMCPAKDLDDETECDVSMTYSDYYNMQNDSLKFNLIDAMFDFIRPYTTEETFNMSKTFIRNISDKNGGINRKFLFDFDYLLQGKVPDNIRALFINFLVSASKVLDNEEDKRKIEVSIAAAYFAKERIGICSLAESDSNEYMWKNYADEDSGYCVEYDFENYKYIEDLRPVLYEDEREFNIIKQLMLSFVGLCIRSISKGEVQPDISQFERLFTTKYRKWEYQNEWRLLGDAKKKLEAPKISKIIFGKNITNENKVKITDFCNKNKIKIVIRE